MGDCVKLQRDGVTLSLPPVAPRLLPTEQGPPAVTEPPVRNDCRGLSRRPPGSGRQTNPLLVRSEAGSRRRPEAGTEMSTRVSEGGSTETHICLQEQEAQPLSAWASPSASCSSRRNTTEAASWPVARTSRGLSMWYGCDCEVALVWPRVRVTRLAEAPLSGDEAADRRSLLEGSPSASPGWWAPQPAQGRPGLHDPGSHGSIPVGLAIPTRCQVPAAQGSSSLDTGRPCLDLCLRWLWGPSDLSDPMASSWPWGEQGLQDGAPGPHFV